MEPKVFGFSLKSVKSIQYIMLLAFVSLIAFLVYVATKKPEETKTNIKKQKNWFYVYLVNISGAIDCVFLLNVVRILKLLFLPHKYLLGHSILYEAQLLRLMFLSLFFNYIIPSITTSFVSTQSICNYWTLASPQCHCCSIRLKSESASFHRSTVTTPSHPSGSYRIVKLPSNICISLTTSPRSFSPPTTSSRYQFSVSLAVPPTIDISAPIKCIGSKTPSAAISSYSSCLVPSVCSDSIHLPTTYSKLWPPSTSAPTTDLQWQLVWKTSPRSTYGNQLHYPRISRSPPVETTPRNRSHSSSCWA